VTDKLLVVSICKHFRVEAITRCERFVTGESEILECENEGNPVNRGFIPRKANGHSVRSYSRYQRERKI
jgi:hypothetical protein